MKPEKGKKKEKAPQPVKKEESLKGGSLFLNLLFNLIGGGAAMLFIYILFSPWTNGMNAEERAHITEKSTPNIQGYFWLYNIMLKGNDETMEANPGLSVPAKYELKWGGKPGYGEISYFNRISQSTPDSAIIIVPPRKLLTQVGFKSAVELPWLTYFVYPRKVVYEDDKDSSNIYKRANYILSVNGWGLDKLNYQVEKPEGFMILPLKK